MKVRPSLSRWFSRIHNPADQTSATDELTPDYLAIAEAATQHHDWKQALDSVIAVVRSVFLFDNMALFLREHNSENLTEVVYARAIGRERQAGAEAPWGQEVATEVLRQNKFIVRTPDKTTPRRERLSFPYFLGLPMRTPNGVIGVLSFVRFGGPVYTPSQIQHGQYIATQFASLFERKRLHEEIDSLAEARRLLHLQDDFIATISHELRTPLGFIKGYSTTLLRPDTEWDEATRHEFLTIIDEEADRLTHLIENMLESARIQSETLTFNFQPVRLESLIRDVMIRNQARYKDLKVTLNLERCSPILADGVRVSQVLDNLFSNAIKYAPGASIAIGLRISENQQIIEFSDDGPGIKPEYLKHIFDKFYRVPNQGGSGSGLGLFICQQIIRKHGGELSAYSLPGHGATFIISLPPDPALSIPGGKP